MKKPGIKSNSQGCDEFGAEYTQKRNCGKGGTLSLSTRLTLYVGCAA